MKKIIIAMGGGYFGEHKDTYLHDAHLDDGQQSYPNNTLPIDRLVVVATNKKHPRVLLILTASEDGSHDLQLYEKAFRKQYEALGATVETLLLVTEKINPKEIKRKILNSNAIYVSGGSTYLMMKTWRRLGVDVLLREAYESGVVMSGLSAGSICWFKYGNSNSFYTNKPFRATAMGWIDALTCPHYDSEPYRQDTFKKMVKRTPSLIGIALDEHAAIEIVNDEYRVHSYGSGGKARKCFWKNGTYVVNEIVQSEDYSDLSALLLKDSS